MAPARPQETGRNDPVDADTTAREVLRDYLAEPLAVLQEHDADLPAETVHQLRIAARQLHSALGSYELLFEPGTVEPLREELRWLGRSLGAARDSDVLRRLLDELVDEEDDRATVPAWATLRQRIDLDLREAHDAGRRLAMEVLASARYERFLASLAAVVESPALRPRAVGRARVAIPALLGRDARRVRRAARAAHRADPGPDRDEALHEVRKKAKRLRYSAGAAAPVLGRRARKLAKRAKSLQEVLGTHQDTVASRAWLRDLAERAGDDAVASGAGRLHAREEQRARTAERDYEHALRRLPRKDVERWLQGEAG